MCIRHGFASNNARAESPKAPGLCAVALSGRAFLVAKPCRKKTRILNTLPVRGNPFNHAPYHQKNPDD